MDLHANLISLILRRGRADKITFERLNKLNLCLSYPAALKRQSMLSENSENRVKSWCKMQEVKHTVASQAPSLDKSKLSITLVSQRTEGFEPKQEITAPDICMQEFGATEGDDHFVSTVENLDKSLMEINISDSESIGEITQQPLDHESAPLTSTSDTDVGKLPVFSLDEYVIIDVDEQMIVSEALPGSDVHGNGNIGTLYELDAQIHISEASTGYADLTLTGERNVQNGKSAPSHTIIFEDPDFSLAGDNVNLSQKKRKTSRKDTSKQYNLFNCISVKNRVPYNSEMIKGKVPTTTQVDNVPLSNYFMDKEDNDLLRNEFRIILGWTVSELRQDLNWMKKYLSRNIKHKYMGKTASNSEVVS